jgi:hypothetical protein
MAYRTSEGTPVRFQHVVAIPDDGGPYCPFKRYIRKARTRRERLTGVADASPLEPMILPLTAEDEEMRASMQTEYERAVYETWRRILWRAENYPLIPGHGGRGYIPLRCVGGHGTKPRVLHCECGRSEHACGDCIDAGFVTHCWECRKNEPGEGEDLSVPADTYGTNDCTCSVCIAWKGPRPTA